MNNKYKEEKGNQGEEIVQNIIDSAIEKSGVECRTYRNVILTNKNSSFGGNKFGMTTEVDHIVVTRSYIHVFETKNQEYENTTRIDKEFWDLKNGESILNPILQNYTHKMLLSEILNVNREAIIQHVCLAQVPKGDVDRHKYYAINNHIWQFDDDEMTDKLAQAFITPISKSFYNYDDIIEKIDALELRSSSLQKIHKKNIDAAGELLEWQRKQVRLNYTDAIYDESGTLLKIKKKMTDLPPNRKRRKYKYRLELINSLSGDSVAFLTEDDAIIAKKDTWNDSVHKTLKYQKNFKILSLEERLGYKMNETYQEIINDKITRLERDVELHQLDSQYYKKNNKKLEEQVNNLNSELAKLRDIESKYSNLEKEISRFKPIIFSLYRKEPY